MPEPDYRVEHETTAVGGRYFIRLDSGGEQAELTWRQTAAGVITAEHTYVPASHRGHGLANLLVKQLMEDVRSQDGRVIPACSYVLAEARRNPQWQALTANRPS